MDSNPSSQAKSASRLARMSSAETLHLSLDLVSPSPKKVPSLSPSVPLQELLLLSPSPMRKSRTRLTDRLEMAEEVGLEPNGSRRRCKIRGGQMGLVGYLVVARAGEDKKISLWMINEESFGTLPVAGTDSGGNIEFTATSIMLSLCLILSILASLENISADVLGFTGDEATRRNLKFLIKSLSRLL